jgi:hypothetical protein
MFPEQRQSKAATTIAACMKEHGIENVSITEKEEHGYGSVSQEIIISKTILLGGEDIHLSYNFSITDTELAEGKDILQVHANRAARTFKEKLTVHFEIETGVAANVCLYDGAWAECQYCGETVDVEMSKVAPAFTRDAECSTPNPLSMERQTVVEQMDGHQKVACRLYLLGKLRRNCGATCPTSYKYQRI